MNEFTQTADRLWAPIGERDTDTGVHLLLPPRLQVHAFALPEVPTIFVSEPTGGNNVMIMTHCKGDHRLSNVFEQNQPGGCEMVRSASSRQAAMFCSPCQLSLLIVHEAKRPKRTQSLPPTATARHLGTKLYEYRTGMIVACCR